MPRLGVVSFRLGMIPVRDLARVRKSRRRDLEEVICCAERSGATTLLFPGWTFAYTAREAAQGLPRLDMRWLADRTSSCSAIADFGIPSAMDEYGGRIPPKNAGVGLAAFDAGKLVGPLIRQQITTWRSVKEANPAYCGLLDEVLSGRRTVQVGGVRVLVLSCGEINILRNYQGDPAERNRVALRHGVDGATLASIQDVGYDVLFHAAHTKMGNLGKLKQRWIALSRPRGRNTSRVVVYTTNRVGSGSGSSDTYIFRNGSECSAQPEEYASPRSGRWSLRTIPL